MFEKKMKPASARARMLRETCIQELKRNVACGQKKEKTGKRCKQP